jgi:hypothetical protein
LKNEKQINKSIWKLKEDKNKNVSGYFENCKIDGLDLNEFNNMFNFNANNYFVHKMINLKEEFGITRNLPAINVKIKQNNNSMIIDESFHNITDNIIKQNNGDIEKNGDKLINEESTNLSDNQQSEEMKIEEEVDQLSANISKNNEVEMNNDLKDSTVNENDNIINNHTNEEINDNTDNIEMQHDKYSKRKLIYY